MQNQRALAGINFNGFRLGPKLGEELSLDGFIDRLLDLAFFHANSNGFTGIVPQISITKIRFLFELDLSNNRMTGEFPYQVLSAKNLTFLDLWYNNLGDSVPPKCSPLTFKQSSSTTTNFSTRFLTTWAPC